MDPAPGWRADPTEPRLSRYWDGVGWTGYTSDLVHPGGRARRHVRAARFAVIVAGIAIVSLLPVVWSATNERPLSPEATVATLVACAVLVVSAVVAITEWAIGQSISAREILRAERASPPPGWYRDPDLPIRARYWNGTAWSQHVHDTARSGGDAVTVSRLREKPSEPPNKPSLGRVPLGCGVRFLYGMAWLVGLGLVAFGAFAVWSKLHPPPSYGYNAADRTEYRITRIVAAAKPDQPWLGSRAALRDYLRRSGAGCRNYSEHSYGPQEEALLFTREEWAECVGMGRYILRTYTDSPDKRADINNRAHCGGSPDSDLAPFKPRFWIEGPNWVVEMVSGLRSDVPTTESAARRTAAELDARLYESCALGTARRASIGEPLAHDSQILVVNSIQDPFVWPDHAPPSGFRYVAVKLTVSDRGARAGTFLLPEMGIHDDGTETYFQADSDSPLTSVATANAPQASGALIVAIPSTMQHPVLRVSWIFPWHSGSPAETDLGDIVLRP